MRHCIQVALFCSSSTYLTCEGLDCRYSFILSNILSKNELWQRGGCNCIHANGVMMSVIFRDVAQRVPTVDHNYSHLLPYSSTEAEI